MEHITAIPGLLSVTESVALPPLPKGRSNAKILHIQPSWVVGAPGIIAGLSRTADSRCGGYSMVIHRSAVTPQDRCRLDAHSKLPFSWKV